MESKKWLCIMLALILGMVVPNISSKTVNNSDMLEEQEVMQDSGILEEQEEMQDSGILEDCFSYKELEDGTLDITGYSGSDANLVIPAEIEGKKVTSIGIWAFRNCNFLTSVKIPEGVTVIEMAAFRECESLTEVVIPESVTSIWDFAFYGCSSLENIELPKNVTDIGYSMFGNCKGLRSVKIAGNIDSIGNNMFYGCENLTDIELPGTITNIGEQAFYDCKSLKSIEIPNSVMSIGNSAFYSCESLTEIQLPASLTKIENHTFHNCNSLKDIKIISGITAIGESAFNGCSSLESIEIPDSIVDIGKSAFACCSKLKNFEVSETHPNYASEDGILYNKDKTELIFCPGGKTGNITVASGVINIGSNGFYYCEDVTAIKLPDSVTGIRSHAFSHCSAGKIELPGSITSIGDSVFSGSGITEIELPDSITEMGNTVFYNCKNLVKVKLPKSITTIGENTFFGCHMLKGIEIPESVTNINIYAFQYCSRLQRVKISSNVEVIGAGRESEQVFEGCDKELTLFVEAGSVAEAYAKKYGIKTDLYENYSYPEESDTPDPGPGITVPPSIRPDLPDESDITTCTHVYEKKITRNATCSVRGEETWTCVRCGESYIEYLPLKSHSMETIVMKAGIEEDGSIAEKCSLCGIIQSQDIIYGIEEITMFQNSAVYNGKNQTTFVSVKDNEGNTLKSGRDYTVSVPKTMKNVGKYTVTVTLKGNYRGAKNLTFTIKPKGTSISRLTAASKGFKVKWKKQAKQITGYRIQYSTSKKFTKKTTKAAEIKKNKTTSKSIKKLKGSVK